MTNVLKVLAGIAFLFTSISSFSQTTSVASGNWTTVTNWNPNSSYPTGSGTVDVNHAMTVNTNLTISGTYTFNAPVTDPTGGTNYSFDVSGTLNIKANTTFEVGSGKVTISNNANLHIYPGATLTLGIPGSTNQIVDFQNGSTITIDAGGTLIVYGALNNSNNSDQVVVNGSVTVYGNVTAGNGSGIDGAGSFNTDCSYTSTCSISNSGSIFGSSSSCTTGPCDGTNMCSITNNTISANQTICSGSTPAGLTGLAVPSVSSYSWEKSTTSATSSFSAISSTNTQNYSPGSLSQTTWYRRLATKSGCQNSSNVISVTVKSSGLWQGTSSVNWNTAGNWCGGVPNSSTDVVVNSGPINMPSVDITTAACNTLTINSGASLTIASGKTLTVTGAITIAAGGTLNIANGGTLVSSGSITNSGTMINNGAVTLYSNITNSGTYIATGSITFIGSSAQSVTGTISFNNVIINNSGTGVTLNGSTTINGILTLTAGTLISGGNLTVNLNTGAIAGTGTGSITGNIIVTKNVGSGSFHYLSAPLSGLKVSDWSDNLPLSNNYYYYNETAHSTSSQGMAGWSLISSTATSLTPLQGYALNFNSSTVVDATGTYSHGSTPANLSLTRTNPSSLGIDGWNLVGNPYPSTIDWDAASGWTKTNVLNGIYFWDGANFRYVTYVAGVSSPSGTASNLIAPMQGFYVRVDTTKSSGTLGATNAVRVTSSVPSLWRMASQDNILRLKLSSAGYYDETVLRISDQATDYFDKDLDGYKLSNDGYVPTFYSLLNGDIYSINSIPLLADEKIVPINMVVKFTGDYSIEASEIVKFDNSISCILEDRVANKFVDLRKTSNYTFNVGADGLINNRFYIHLKSEVGPARNPNSSLSDQAVNIYSANGSINMIFKNIPSSNASIMIVDRLGKEVRKVDNANISSGSYSIPMLGDEGIYMVKVITGNDTYTSKVFLVQ